MKAYKVVVLTTTSEAKERISSSPSPSGPSNYRMRLFISLASELITQPSATSDVRKYGEIR